MSSFLLSMYPDDEKIAKYLYNLGTNFMGGEMQESCDIEEIHLLLRRVARDITNYNKTRNIPDAAYSYEGEKDAVP